MVRIDTGKRTLLWTPERYLVNVRSDPVQALCYFFFNLARAMTAKQLTVTIRKVTAE